MARRAVGVLQKMPAYRILPQEIHYTEVWEDNWYDTMILCCVYAERKHTFYKNFISLYSIINCKYNV